MDKDKKYSKIVEDRGFVTDMKANSWTVAGRNFRTEYDYRAACRDQELITTIKNKVDFQNEREMTRLYQEMKDGKYHFTTIVGKDFEEEIHESVQKLTKKSIHDDKKHRKVISLDEYDSKMREQIIKELKKRERIHRVIVAMLSLVAVLCIGYFGFYYYNADQNNAEFSQLSELKNKINFNSDITGVVGKTEDEVITREILSKYQSLYQKNRSLIGWVKIQDTKIDYPVMQSVNEDYYLDHNYEQQKDRNGSIFMDADCNATMPSTNLIIYGHNMKSGAMFGTLSNYEQEDFYIKHKYIEFDTIYEEAKYEIMYAFRSRLYSEEEIVFKYYQFIEAPTEEEFNSNMNEMANISLYDTGVRATFGDQLLTLSTCDYNEKNGRFVVVARRIED